MTVATSWALVAAAILIVAAVLHIWQLTAARRRPPVGPCRAAPEGGRVMCGRCSHASTDGCFCRDTRRPVWLQRPDITTST